jgi:hypothetical protein
LKDNPVVVRPIPEHTGVCFEPFEIPEHTGIVFKPIGWALRAGTIANSSQDGITGNRHARSVWQIITGHLGLTIKPIEYAPAPGLYLTAYESVS